MRAIFTQALARIRGRNPKLLIMMTRNVSISCRGVPISDEELFLYSNGRFLVNEKQQFLKRRVKFDVQKLCDVVASVTKDGAPVSKIEKMEGGFSKALLITTETGVEVIAKIPCPNAGRAMYSTASEAAVLQYVSSHTTLPVPKVLAWNADAPNPIGAEYIIMEKAPGIQLFKVWNEMTEASHLQLIKGLTQMEHQLADIQLPAYGSLYFRHSILKASERIPLDSSVDPSGLFCVGPACGPAWTDGTSPSDIQANLDAGPWPTLLQYGVGLIRRSIARTGLPPPENIIPQLHGAVQDHISALNATSMILPSLAKYPPLMNRSRPTLWHTDLHMGNIFVSQEDHTQIVGFIDWQSTSISPLFIQVRWPTFLSPPEGYINGTGLPKLPANYEDLDADEKEIASFEKERATCAKAYEVATYLNNHDAYIARWELFEPLREIFLRCGDTWEDGIIPLRTCLIRIFKSWKQIGLPDPCPIHFTAAEIESNERQSSEYTQWHEIQEFAKKYLDTDDEGWVPPEVNWAEKQSLNMALLELMTMRLETQKSADEVRRMWPFAM